MLFGELGEAETAYKKAIKVGTQDEGVLMSTHEGLAEVDEHTDRIAPLSLSLTLILAEVYKRTGRILDAGHEYRLLMAMTRRALPRGKPEKGPDIHPNPGPNPPWL